MLLSNQVLYQTLIIIFTILIIIFLLLFFITKNIYNMFYGRRYDKTFLHFFTHNDFEGLNAESIEFNTNNQNVLRGYIYSYNQNEYKGLIILSHGLGVGHLQYTCEINHFAKLGFKVLSFDNTGCATSDGEGINGLPQGIIDLKSCLNFIKTRDDLNHYKKVLFGHSWGGYSSINVLPFTNEEDHIVCVVTLGAPYNSSEITYEILKSNSKLFSFTGPFISLIEKNRFGLLAKMNTLSTLINTNVDTLLIHGDKDNIANYETNFKFVENNLNKSNIEFYTVKNKMHRPNISDDATRYDTLVNKEINDLKRNKSSKEKLKEYHDNIDYNKLVEFDNEVMTHIDEFILKHFN